MNPRTLELHTHLIDKLAFVNGLVSGLALYPQIFSVFMGKEIVGLSLTTFSLILLNSLIWSLYALHRQLLSLLIASLLNTVASGMLCIAILASR